MATHQAGEGPVETLAEEQHLWVFAGRWQSVGDVQDRLARAEVVLKTDDRGAGVLEHELAQLPRG